MDAISVAWREGFAAVLTMIEKNWEYVPSPPPWSWRKHRLVAALKLRKPFPKYLPLKKPESGDRWTLFFIFAPDGCLHSSHIYSLKKLRQLDRKLMVICAAPSAEKVPALLHEISDALYWKELRGYDFSAYAIGLKIISDLSNRSSVFVMNDSVLGPFEDISRLVESPPWEITAFTGSPQFENHIQSYAFVIRELTAERLARLRQIFGRRFSYDGMTTVVACMETRFARVASRTMTVGAYWFGPDDGTDPTVEHAIDLRNNGFPFLKKSLLGKHRARAKEKEVRDALRQLDHPPFP